MVNPDNPACNRNDDDDREVHEDVQARDVVLSLDGQAHADVTAVEGAAGAAATNNPRPHTRDRLRPPPNSPTVLSDPFLLSLLDLRASWHTRASWRIGAGNVLHEASGDRVPCGDGGGGGG